MSQLDTIAALKDLVQDVRVNTDLQVVLHEDDSVNLSIIKALTVKGLNPVEYTYVCWCQSWELCSFGNGIKYISTSKNLRKIKLSSKPRARDKRDVMDPYTIVT